MLNSNLNANPPRAVRSSISVSRQISFLHPADASVIPTPPNSSPSTSVFVRKGLNESSSGLSSLRSTSEDNVEFLTVERRLQQGSINEEKAVSLSE